MTLAEIIEGALEQTRRGTDSQTIKQFQGRFTQYANEAQADLAKDFPIYRVDKVEGTGGVLDVNTLPRWCTKIMTISNAESKPVAFDAGPATGLIKVGEDGELNVTYRHIPRDLENLTDEPELPQQLHRCIVTWVVARDISEGDPSTQSGASTYFQVYNDQKRALMRGGMGTPASYKFKNMERW